MKSSCRYSKGQEGGGLRLWEQNYFSKIMHLTDQTLVINCFHSFIQVSPLLFIHNLSNLKCTMVGKRMQIWNIGLPRSQEEPSSCFRFLIALNSLNLQPLYIHLNFWFKSRLLPCCTDIRMGKIWQQVVTFCRRMDFIHMYHNLYRFCCHMPLHKSWWGHSPDI